MPRLAQKWYEEDCRSPPAITRTNRQMEKERYSFRNRLHAPRRGPFSQPRNLLILCGSFSALRQFAMAVGLLFSKSSHPLVRPPSALYGFCYEIRTN